jgi:predicted  nucleic acid-binding Zn-ribbon protein
MPQNSPKTHTNEGKLIKKLAEKQKMLEKYEQMLQKVNVEFQNTLTKNKELADKISSLELRCLRAEENASSFKGKVNGDQYTVQRQLDELTLEKDDLQSDNVSLNKLLKNKNYEIEEFQKIKLELENRLVNHSTDNANITKNEVEYGNVIDQLKKHVLDLEFELTKKDEDYRIDVANCDLIAQSLTTENDQLTIQRNELTEQNTKYKEQIWKDTLVSRQVTDS